MARSVDSSLGTIDAVTAITRNFSDSLSLNVDDGFGLFNVSTIQDDELSRFSRPLLTFAAVATVLIMAVGVSGNLLTVVALLKCPRVRNVAAAFIISLCIADFIFCIAVLPFSISRFYHGDWTHGDILCTLFPFMRYGNVGVSLLSIAMITINRYIMIAHHSSYSRIYRRECIAAMIIFCWLFSYGMQLPTLFRVWGKFDFDPILKTCSILEDDSGNSSKKALFIIGFVIPCLVIVVCYARIFWVVHKSEQRMRKHSTTRLAVIATTPFDRRDREAKRKRNEWRITKMVLAIFLSFVICYLPITIVKVADKEVNYPGFHVLGYLMLYLSACINPIIYVIMNKQYRQAYQTVLMCRRPRLLSFSAKELNEEKSKDQNSRTMVSQVSLAMIPINLPAEDLPEVFDEKM